MNRVYEMFLSEPRSDITSFIQNVFCRKIINHRFFNTEGFVFVCDKSLGANWALHTIVFLPAFIQSSNCYMQVSIKLLMRIGSSQMQMKSFNDSLLSLSTHSWISFWQIYILNFIYWFPLICNKLILYNYNV